MMNHIINQVIHKLTTWWKIIQENKNPHLSSKITSFFDVNVVKLGQRKMMLTVTKMINLLTIS